MKKFVSVMLALVMTLALATPAFAAKKDAPGQLKKLAAQVEETVGAITNETTPDEVVEVVCDIIAQSTGEYTKIEDDASLAAFAAGEPIDLSGLATVWVKQANGALIWVADKGEMSDADIIAAAQALDKSLVKGTSCFAVVTGDGVFFTPNTNGSQATVTVAEGKMTIAGAISHVCKVTGDDIEPEEDDTGALEVKIGSVVQEYMYQVHQDVYKYYEPGTIISSKSAVDGTVVTAYDLAGNANQTYLTINKAALEEAGSITVDFAVGAKNEPVPAKKDTDKTPSYTLTIADGKLVINSELENFGAVTLSAGSVPGSGGSSFGGGDFATNSHISDGTTATLAIPEGETFNFFIHVECKGDYGYYTNEVVGCEVVSTETREQAYECTPVIAVTDAEGNECTDLTALPAGTYTVKVTVGSDEWTETVGVVAGETVTADFGKLTVSTMGEPVVVGCTYDGCPGYVAPDTETTDGE